MISTSESTRRAGRVSASTTLVLAVALSTSAVQAASSPSLTWGTYRPQNYFGVRPRIPDSILTGLAWFNAASYDGYANIRHECNGGDNLQRMVWTHHDGRNFGIQEIVDQKSNYRLTTSFLKGAVGQGGTAEDNSKGGSWGVRIEGHQIDPSEQAELSAIFYIGAEGTKGFLSLENEESDNGLLPETPIVVSGSTPQLGEFALRIEESFPEQVKDDTINHRRPNGIHLDDFKDRIGKTQFVGRKVPAEHVWAGKEQIIKALSDSMEKTIATYGREDLPQPSFGLQFDNEVQSSANFLAFQNTYVGNFSFDVFFDSTDSAGSQKLTSEALTAGLRASKEAYEQRLKGVLRLEDKGYTSSQIDFAREVTSSLLGGVGYYHGSSIVDRSFVHDYDVGVGGGVFDADDKPEPDPRLTEDSSLFTATPSRVMFPRGFYWDEGFHLAHIGVVDNDLSLEILQSWIDLIDDDGWVAREQVLGLEARSRVPAEFLTQYPMYANPPTLIMAITMYLDRLQSATGQVGSLGNSGGLDAQDLFSGDRETTSQHSTYLSPEPAREFLKIAYPKLRTHYQWFRRTQRGEITQWDREARSRTEGYRWRGRTKEHVLTSGLDDYPRATVPHSGELHVDLLSWMGSFARAMERVAETIGEEDDVEEYRSHLAAIKMNIDDLHWNDDKKMFCDATVDENDSSVHVCHMGYISLFPFFLGLLPADSPKLEHIFDALHDPQQLWTTHGVRSLSKQDPNFGQGENYWKGPIWAPMNYMILGTLKKVYAAQPGPYQARAQSIYDELRKNFVDNVYQEYNRTGYTWEQYNTEDGHGQRSKPFTGWTSLTALIMAEIY